MNAQRLTIVLALAGLVAGVSPAHAFDGDRKGFVLGVGLGYGVSSYTQTLEASGVPSSTSDRESKTGIASDFRIGWGPSGQFLLYYDNRVNWFGFDNVLGQNVTIADGLSSLGVSYYFQPSAPGAFLTGGIGGASWSTPLEENSGGMVGFGVFGGAGYEFSKLLSLEATLSIGSPSDAEAGLKVTTNTLGFRVMAVLLGY